jgi:hypothetical protein
MVFEGGAVDRDLILLHGQPFSLNALAASPEETLALRRAFSGENGKDDDLEQMEGSPFQETLRWLLRTLQKSRLASSQLSTNTMIAVPHRCPEGTNDSVIAHQWGEVEFRRRVHYGLELLLSAFSRELKDMSHEGSPAATIEEAVARWTEDAPACEVITELWPSAGRNWAVVAGAALADITTDRLWREPITRAKFHGVTQRDQALGGIMLLWTCSAMDCRENGAPAFSQFNSAGDHALTIVRQAMANTHAGDAIPIGRLADLAARLLSEVVVPAHLTVTLRKMGAGLDCSLRFFPDGDRYRSTGIVTTPGFSNDRLTNVMTMLADIGLLTVADGEFSLSVHGKAMLEAIAA